MLNVLVINVVRVSCDTLIYPTYLFLLLQIACFSFILVGRAVASNKGLSSLVVALVGDRKFI